MMNDIDNEKYMELFQDVDNRPRMTRIHYKNDYSENKCREKVLKAALIRLYLIKSLYFGSKDISAGSKTDAERLWKFPSAYEMRKLLKEEYSIKDYRAFIQKEIRILRALCQMQHGSAVADYASVVIDIPVRAKNQFEIFAGERYMLYRLLQKEYRKNPKVRVNDRLKENEWVQWFYAYLV